MEGKFRDRGEAGGKLAERLSAYRGRDDTVVLGLARGGVPVAYEVARQLGLPLDVFVVRKLGVPGFEELAMGAIASGNVSVLNQDVVSMLPDPAATLEAVIALEEAELQRRELCYRPDRPPLDLQGKVVILIDDGLATGATMRAATAALRKQRVAKIVIAVPVGAPETCQEMESEADEMVCVLMPASFHGVGQFYQDFSQTTDDEVRQLLAGSRKTQVTDGG